MTIVVNELSLVIPSGGIRRGLHRRFERDRQRRGGPHRALPVPRCDGDRGGPLGPPLAPRGGRGSGCDWPRNAEIVGETMLKR